jgi:hypothetical protein
MSRPTRDVRNLCTMTERAHADRGSTMGGWHFQISKLLVIMSACAVAATGALVVTILVDLPGRPPALGPNGQPPPPPDLQSLAVFPVITGLFVLAWLAVLVVAARDQILQRLADLENRPGPRVDRRQVDELFTELRENLAADREAELHTLGERIAALTTEYGEQRETDGYLNGMRVATGDAPREENVRPIRRMPPQR